MEHELATERLKVEGVFARCVLKPEVIRMRSRLREHFAAEGHDRCWLDDELLFEQVLGLPPLAALYPREEFMQRCRLYQTLAHDDIVPPEHQLARENPDADLDAMGFIELRREFAKIVRAVRVLYEKSEEERRAEDYRAMYAASLPECNPDLEHPFVADLRLPENLLEGCEAFYDDCLAFIPEDDLRKSPPPWPIAPEKLHRWEKPLPDFIGHNTRKQ